ncbi:MAG: RNA methyltransferase [Chromatiaceae bacterium]|nr:MAG: RNA methyltransferase [Chromatiaceae bacterium]
MSADTTEAAARPGADRATLARALDRYRPLLEADWGRFLEALQTPLAPCLWANPTRIDGPGLAALLAVEGIPSQPIPWLAGTATGAALRLPLGVRPGQCWWYCAGLAHAQEAVSQLPVRLLAVHPGQRVLDLCAAPGGKTAQLALALDNRGTLLANDIFPERIAALQGNLDRLGIVNCTSTWCDGGNYPAAAGPFDRILVDAPCSSEGTLRRNQSLAARLAGRPPAERSARLLPRQRALLRKAVQLCRPGGRIVYSTCTFAPEENELIVAEALEQAAGQLRLLAVEVPGLMLAPGLTAWAGRSLDPSLARCVRLWPHHNDTGGFFIAVLEKATSAPAVAEAAPLTLAPGAGDDDQVAALAAHYGLAAALASGYRIQRQTRRGLHLMAADHCPPAAPPAQGSGLFFHRTNTRPPKLTTAGALRLGAHATRQCLDLDRVQRDAYLRREQQTPTAAQTRDCHPGQVLVRYQGYPLGVAILHRSGTLESLFPRRWSGCAAGA